MKIGAQICLHDDYQFLEAVLDRLHDDVDVIYIMLNNKPWRGENLGNQECKQFCYDSAASYPKVKIIEGEWNTEHEQRNAALTECKKNNVDYCMIIDSDEILSDNAIKNLKSIIKNNPDINIYACMMDTFWRLSPFCIIQPREGSTPVICVKSNKFLFTSGRQGVGLDKFGRHAAPATALLPENALVLYHLSYARTDSFIKKKVSNMGEKQAGGWYDKVWLKWTPDMTNIHPVNPSQYHMAVPIEPNFLPKKVRDIIEFEKEMTNWKPDPKV